MVVAQTSLITTLSFCLFVCLFGVFLPNFIKNENSQFKALLVSFLSVCTGQRIENSIII